MGPSSIGCPAGPMLRRMKPLDLLDVSLERVIETDPRPATVPRPQAAPRPQLDPVACGWCGMFSPPGPACEACGSPLNLHRNCQHCGLVTTMSFCWSCGVPVEKNGSLLKKS